MDGWRKDLEGRGMKVTRSKTEYMCLNERQTCITVKMQRVEGEWVEMIVEVICEVQIAVRVKGRWWY